MKEWKRIVGGIKGLVKNLLVLIKAFSPFHPYSSTLWTAALQFVSGRMISIIILTLRQNHNGFH
jgi:hypothetical protein